MCMVEVEGARTLLPACATPATPGMVIKTESDRMDAARQIVLEMLLASGNHNCLVCETNGVCELQALAYRYRWRRRDFPFRQSRPRLDVEDNKLDPPGFFQVHHVRPVRAGLQ